MQIKYYLLWCFGCCANGLSHFVKYNHIEIINIFENYVQYTNNKLLNSKYGSEERNYWHSSNRNCHIGIRHAKLKENKCIYLGWNYNEEINNEDNYIKIIPFYIFLDIESMNIIRLVNIISNPHLNSEDYSVKIFKKELLDFVNNIGIYLDFSELKNIDNGKWYLNMITNL